MHAEAEPDPTWVAHLTGSTQKAAVEGIREAQSQTRLFAHLRKEHRKEGRESYIEIDAPLELHALVRRLRPSHVVEVGVSSGVSSAYVLNALHLNSRGTLHSVDLPSFPRKPSSGDRRPGASWSLPIGRSTGWAVPFALKKRWDLRLGDKADVLPLLAEELPSIDLVVYDVPHEDESTASEFRLIDPLFPAGAVAIVDHGPDGGLCSALKAWATKRGAEPVRRQGLGLYGMRAAHTPTR